MVGACTCTRAPQTEKGVSGVPPSLGTQPYRRAARTQAGHTVVVVDNLCNSNIECLKRVQELAGRSVEFHEVDIRDKVALAAVFAQHRPDAVIHFAGLKAVGESVAKPLLYYEVNVV